MEGTNEATQCSPITDTDGMANLHPSIVSTQAKDGHANHALRVHIFSCSRDPSATSALPNST